MSTKPEKAMENERVPLALSSKPSSDSPLRRLAVRLLMPSLGDFLFFAVLAMLFLGSTGGWEQLLADGDTGWHIRTGEWILRNHAVPQQDLYSYSKPGAPWFAWEWLADVIFASAHAQAGLKGVALVSGLLICLSLLLLFRYMLWRGAGFAVALLLTLFTGDASQIHYLARPHVFTLVLLPISLWLLDRDRREPTAAVWLLAPLAALWANLHAGFVALFIFLALGTASSLVRGWMAPRDGQRFATVRRQGMLSALCLLATLANPYGYHLHEHIVRYLRSDWIQKVVQEFQPSGFGSEGMYKFETLVFLGIAVIPTLLRSRRFEDALGVGFWAHAGLKSARHIPVYFMAAAPVVGTELGLFLARYTASAARSSILGVLDGLVKDLTAQARRTSIWIPAVAVILWVMPAGAGWPKDFPAKFPSELIGRNISTLAPAGRPYPRLLSSDEWGGYLIYRLYPSIRVFMDGRSDFYGPEVGNDYICLLHACEKWQAILDRRHFDVALIPRDWPLAELLKTRADWRMLDQDKTAYLFRKTF